MKTADAPNEPGWFWAKYEGAQDFKAVEVVPMPEGELGVKGQDFIRVMGMGQITEWGGEIKK